MTATHFHHLDKADDFTIHHYLDDDPSTGVVLLADSSGVVTPERVSAIEPWTESAP